MWINFSWVLLVNHRGDLQWILRWGSKKCCIFFFQSDWPKRLNFDRKKGPNYSASSGVVSSFYHFFWKWLFRTKVKPFCKVYIRVFSNRKNNGGKPVGVFHCRKFGHFFRAASIFTSGVSWFARACSFNEVKNCRSQRVGPFRMKKVCFLFLFIFSFLISFYKQMRFSFGNPDCTEWFIVRVLGVHHNWNWSLNWFWPVLHRQNMTNYVYASFIPLIMLLSLFVKPIATMVNWKLKGFFMQKSSLSASSLISLECFLVSRENRRWKRNNWSHSTHCAKNQSPLVQVTSHSPAIWFFSVSKKRAHSRDCGSSYN